MTTDRNPREAINHGHNDWNGAEWVATFQTWCPSCRAAQSRHEGSPAMKVVTRIVIDVDPDAYRAEYGSDEKAPDIREYVQSFAEAAVAEAFRPFSYATVNVYAADSFGSVNEGN